MSLSSSSISSGTGKLRLPGLDGLRAVAAGLVLLTHAGSASGANTGHWFGPVLARGDFGVPLFFVLSGFLLTRMWVRPWRAGRPRPSLSRYALHRAVRIYPAYWPFIIVAMLTTTWLWSYQTVIANLTLTQQVFGGLQIGWFHIWSLCTEMAFYVVLPLLTWLVLRRSQTFALIAIAGLAAVAPISIALIDGPLADHVPLLATTMLPAHLDWFAAGMAIAVLEPQLQAIGERSRRPVSLRSGTWLVIAAALAGIALTPLAGPRTFGEVSVATAITKELLYCAIAGLIVAALIPVYRKPAIWHRVLDSRLMRWLGKLSFAFFLWHFIILRWVRDLLGLAPGEGGFIPTLLLTGALSLVVAQLSWWLIEGPGQRWLRRRDQRTRPSPTPRVAANPTQSASAID